MNKLLFGISLARKSGKFVSGFDPVKEAVLNKSAKIVIIARDISEKTVKRVRYFCDGVTPIYISELTQFDFSQVAGRLTGVMAVTDENLAKLCSDAISK